MEPQINGIIDITKADLDKVEVLPDSRAKVVRNTVKGMGVEWVQVFCANCGCDQGRVPEENCDFAMVLCEPCAEKLSPVLQGYYIEPNVKFWEKVRRAQIEKYGRELTEMEVMKELDNESSIIAKLAKDRAKLGR